jgi:2-oxoglutarate/2-oxoacid ferredoxin oxidoreductase subunit alpha
MDKMIAFMEGNEACAEGALYAGCTFFAGYPITPSSEIAEYLSKELPKRGGIFIQMEDEIASIAACIGASLTGAKSLTATSGPGYSLMQELIGYACITEVPCVISNVMRGGPSTGDPTKPLQADVMQAKWGTHGDHAAIALCPDSVQETFEMTVRAFNLAEQFRNPVTILSDEIVGHMREKVIIPEPGELAVVNRKKPDVTPDKYLPYDSSKGDIPPMANYGEGYRFHVTGLKHDDTGFPTNDNNLSAKGLERIVRKVESRKNEIIDLEYYKADDAGCLFVAYGPTARSARRAVDELRRDGKKVGLLRLKTIWPFADDQILEIARKAKYIIVPEMNLGQIYFEVKRAVEGTAKVFPLFRVDTEPITPKELYDKVKEIYK